MFRSHHAHGGRAEPPLLLWALLPFVLAWFAMLGLHDLIRPDEGRYAEIAREMLASGDWLTPRLNALKYFEKPPLQYWATATAYTLFGQHDWTARLWAGLTGFLGILFTWHAGRRLFGPRSALFGAVALGSSALWVMIGHFNTLDMGVSFFLSAAVLSFALAQREDATQNQWRRYMALTWAALAAAMLSKGLIALVLPGATLVAYMLWQRDWGLIKRLWLIPGLALFALIGIPWFVLVAQANPEFFHFFFIHEHFERFLTKAHGRYQPMWYFLPILLLGIVPWTLTLFPALASPLRRQGGRSFRADRLLLVWILVVFGFFSVSSSKLASYILPIFPAVALLLGRTLNETSGRVLRWQVLPLLPLGVVFALFAATRGTDFADAQTPAALYAGFIPWLVAGGATLAGTALAAFVLFGRERKTGAVFSLAAGGFALCLAIYVGHDTLSPFMSAKRIANEVRDRIDAKAPFYSVNTYDQTLQPYLGRTTTLVSYQDELSFGIGIEPQKFIPTVEEFERRWRADPVAYALLTPDHFEQLNGKGLPMVVLARDTRRVIVRKP